MAKLLASLATLMLVLGGCASQPANVSATYADNCDWARMDQVERAARHYHATDVRWLNCPQRRASL